jgi:hypothetical protein
VRAFACGYIIDRISRNVPKASSATFLDPKPSAVKRVWQDTTKGGFFDSHSQAGHHHTGASQPRKRAQVPLHVTGSGRRGHRSTLSCARHCAEVLHPHHYPHPQLRHLLLLLTHLWRRVCLHRDRPGHVRAATPTNPLVSPPCGRLQHDLDGTVSAGVKGVRSCSRAAMRSRKRCAAARVRMCRTLSAQPATALAGLHKQSALRNCR